MHEIWTRNSQIYPVGVPIAHSWLDVGAILKIIQDCNIRSFVEIGVDLGGLAALLVAYGAATTKLAYTGVELRQITNPHLTIQGGMIYSRVDIFSPGGHYLLRSIIKGAMAPRLIYCDNGDKVREFEKMGPLVAAGDYIACHDFGNEFALDDLSLPATLERVKTSWLEDTNIVLFRGVIK